MKYDTLYGIILEQIRLYARQAFEHEDEIAGRLLCENNLDMQWERTLVEKSIAEDTERLAAIDRLIANQKMGGQPPPILHLISH